MNINILQNAYNKESLFKSKRNNEEGLEDKLGNFFPIVNGYPNFLANQEITGLNKKYQKFYDKIGKWFGPLEGISSFFINFEKMRVDWLKDIAIQQGEKVLEVSVGTGWNIKCLPKTANYFGLDISKGMLDKCVKNKRKWKLNMDLCLGTAEYLPYKDESFNAVFHIGGINFFNDRAKAIQEMIRVAKSGTKIIIIDETEKDIKEQYQKIPFAKKYFKDEDIDRDRLIAPIQLVPITMQEKEIKIIDKGSMYQLSFVKP